MGIKVKVRHIDDADPVDFCEVPWGTDFDDVIRFIRRWGGMIDYSDLIEDSALVGQFIYTDGEFFFEIILGWEE